MESRCFRLAMRATWCAPFALAAEETACSGMSRSSFRPRDHWLPIIASWPVSSTTRPLWRPFAPGFSAKTRATAHCTRNALNLRARYAQKWSDAAEDLAKVIKFEPDDVQSWHRRTMLLVKLQQEAPLVEHLTKMLATFQDNSRTWGWLMHDLTTFSGGRPELIQECELLAGKLPINQQTRFWAAIAALPCR